MPNPHFLPPVEPSYVGQARRDFPYLACAAVPGIPQIPALTSIQDLIDMKDRNTYNMHPGFYVYAETGAVAALEHYKAHAPNETFVAALLEAIPSTPEGIEVIRSYSEEEAQGFVNDVYDVYDPEEPQVRYVARALPGGESVVAASLFNSLYGALVEAGWDGSSYFAAVVVSALW